MCVLGSEEAKRERCSLLLSARAAQEEEEFERERGIAGDGGGRGEDWIERTPRVCIREETEKKKCAGFVDVDYYTGYKRLGEPLL